MNEFEREKFIRFCDRSINNLKSKKQKEFREVLITLIKDVSHYDPGNVVEVARSLNLL